MRRDVSREQLFFVVVLAGALLLLSGLMLRHESAHLPSRTFRDGFTVAEGVVRRMEDVANASGGNETEVPTLPPPVVGTEAEAEVRTTTIKTEDGDEITIKRAATSKGKITTISRHENGKLTIEDTTAEERRAEVEEEEDTEEPEMEGEVLGDYEKVALGSPSSILRKDNAAQRREEEAEAEATEGEKDGGEGKEAVIVSGGKKVTVVQVNRSLTKVSLSDVEEDEEGDAELRQPAGRDKDTTR
ncbi:hypothetical protein BBJ28_00007394 [Nothophytophthora sp. Chile5]|nr:hypothetical protein BBJ28_00007394 [Nothophytophthora sp. Chile5]